MHIEQLNEQFQQGAYRHYRLSEYQFLRRFCELTQPSTITVVGGHTNLDLFYAVQECEPKIVNWDPGDSSDPAAIKATHDRYQQITDFRGSYQWIAQTVSGLGAVDTDVDLVWLNALQEQMVNASTMPRSAVLVHDGDLTQAGTVMAMNKHIPLVALGRTIAVYSHERHDWHHPTYQLRQNRRLGTIAPVTEIVR